MPVKSAKTPRKKPKQRRSRETLGVILKGAVQVLEREGYPRATTSRIAERAGVSVGSVYQYFPNKEAILGKVIEESIAEKLASVKTTVDAKEGLPIDSLIRESLKALFEVHLKNPSLEKIYYENTSKVDREGVLHRSLAEAASVIEGVLKAHQSQLRPMDTKMAAFIIANAIEGILQGAATQRPDYLGQEPFLDEVVHLVGRYLRTEPDGFLG